MARQQRMQYRRVMTLSIKAHNNLYTLLSRPTTRQTLANRLFDSREYNGTQILSHSMEVQDHSKLEGASWGLTLLARNYDLNEWQDTRKHNWWYDPIDKEYIEQSALDPTPFNELLEWEQQARLDTYLDVRQRFEFQMDDYTLQYYAELAKFFEIPPVSTMRNQPTFAGASLEAIGSYYLTPPAGYSDLLEEPNTKKYRLELAFHSNRLYGNHAHKPYMPKNWRPILYGPEEFTQEDIDYCMTHNLQDLAKEAVQLNPSLILINKKGNTNNND